MIFVLPSPILYASCVSSGVMLSCISIGTNTGAKIAHFADAEHIKTLHRQQIKIKRTISIIGGIFSVFKKDAPLRAIILPILLEPK